MAAHHASTTGANTQGDVKRRNVSAGQPNGSYVPQQVADKMDEKTKQKVGAAIDTAVHNPQVLHSIWYLY